MALSSPSQIPTSTTNNNNYGPANLDTRNADQMMQKNGPQVFNTIVCDGSKFFIELSNNTNFVLQGGPPGTPVSVGTRDPKGLYDNQLFQLNGPYIMY